MVETAIENNNNEAINFDVLTYKDIKILTNFLSEQGKILPRRVTGLTSKEQKKGCKTNKNCENCCVITVCYW